MCERSGHLRLFEPKETQQGLQEGVVAEPPHQQTAPGGGARKDGAGEPPAKERRWGVGRASPSVRLHLTPSLKRERAVPGSTTPWEQKLSQGSAGRGRLLAKPPGPRSPKPSHSSEPQNSVSNPCWAPKLGHLPVRLLTAALPGCSLPEERVVNTPH